MGMRWRRMRWDDEDERRVRGEGAGSRVGCGHDAAASGPTAHRTNLPLQHTSSEPAKWSSSGLRSEWMHVRWVFVWSRAVPPLERLTRPLRRLLLAAASRAVARRRRYHRSKGPRPPTRLELRRRRREEAPYAGEDHPCRGSPRA